jgi:hypothetical protein
MNLAKDQKLHDQIHKDRDGHQITYGCEGATQHLPPMLSMERKRPKKRRDSCPSVFHAVARTKKDRNDWLQDKP